MKEEVLNLLKSLNVSYRAVSHPAVFTVAESSKHLEEPVKNLLLEDIKTRNKVLVIMAGEQRLDVKALAQALGYKKFQFAKPELLKQTLGVEPGAVSLFGLLHSGAKNVQVVVDKNLLQAEEVGFHPNDNTETIFIPGSAIEKIMKNTGHAYNLLDMSKL